VPELIHAAGLAEQSPVPRIAQESQDPPWHLALHREIDAGHHESRPGPGEEDQHGEGDARHDDDGDERRQVTSGLRRPQIARRLVHRLGRPTPAQGESR
jgi:hypothetical protein